MPQMYPSLWMMIFFFSMMILFILMIFNYFSYQEK